MRAVVQRHSVAEEAAEGEISGPGSEKQAARKAVQLFLSARGDGGRFQRVLRDRLSGKPSEALPVSKVPVVSFPSLSSPPTPPAPVRASVREREKVSFSLEDRSRAEQAVRMFLAGRKEGSGVPMFGEKEAFGQKGVSGGGEGSLGKESSQPAEQKGVSKRGLYYLTKAVQKPKPS
jgi:hypothetical protein